MISLTFWQLFKFSSYLINAVFVATSLKKRVFMEDFLAGKWTGELAHFRPDGSHYDAITKCVMMISRHKENNNSGYIYYETVNQNTDQVVYKGLDQLNKYETDLWFLLNREWNPRFVRVFHKSEHNVDTTKTVYNFTCQATDLIFKQRMNVKIILNSSCILEGCLERVT